MLTYRSSQTRVSAAGMSPHKYLLRSVFCFLTWLHGEKYCIFFCNSSCIPLNFTRSHAVTFPGISVLIFLSGQRQCLVQLSTMPVAVCHGVGPSTDEAHAQAAHNALQYLKIMTKK